jgi:hypothetical protein
MYNRGREKDSAQYTLYDRLILDHLIPVSARGTDIVCQQWKPWIPDIQCLDQNQTPTQNLLLVNWMKFKYRTLPDLSDFLLQTVADHCDVGAKVFVGFNYQFVIHNRFKQDFRELLAAWEQDLDKKGLECVVKLIKAPRTNPYGDCFFIFKWKKS